MKMLFLLILLCNLLSFSFSNADDPLFCLQSSCTFCVPLDNATFILPETCTKNISSEPCSVTVTFIHKANMAMIGFDTERTSDTLHITTILPQDSEIGSILQYHCNSKSLCEWEYLNEVFDHYLNINYSSLIDVLTPDFEFEPPPLSETYNITCIVNETEFLCEEGKCVASTFPNDSQTWEGGCLPRSDFDLSIYTLEIVTTYNDGVIPYFDSSVYYKCYWNICNAFEVVEKIRTAIKTDYEVQLLNLISTIATTPTVTNSSVTSSTTAAAVTNSSVTSSTTVAAVTNNSMISSTTTRRNNGCTHIDIGYHIFFLLIFIFYNKN